MYHVSAQGVDERIINYYTAETALVSAPSSVWYGLYALGKTHMRSTPSISEVSPALPLNGSNVRLIDDGPLSYCQRPFTCNCGPSVYDAPLIDSP